MLLYSSKLLVTMLMVLLIHGSPVFSLPASPDDTTIQHETERVEMYQVVESWIDTFFTGWRPEHDAGRQSATVKLGELPVQKASKPKDLYLAAASVTLTVTPTSSSTPSMYKLLKHTAQV
ncbi:hypothetical protein BC943DRAFT_377124 [Umbelopsis sp. AD052]|nr:hypothetical protein BC943DRAFT_377124 [Umbelopsis sp. AD052]